jgi:hypothetical protein
LDRQQLAPRRDGYVSLYGDHVRSAASLCARGCGAQHEP